MLKNQETFRGVFVPSKTELDGSTRVASGLLHGNGVQNCQQQLKYSLQLLALPVAAQIYMGDSDCVKVETIAQAFEALHQELCAELEQQLTSEQASLLGRIERILAWLSLGTDSWIWSDPTLRRSAEWRQLRGLAREALVAFEWTLDLPPRDATIYRLVGLLGE